MTADRSWVRLIARWLARVDGISGMLRLAMLALTGVSTMSLTLRDYGLGRFVWPIIGAMSVCTLLFAFYYTEGGVWNQVHRDKRDMSQDYSDPNHYVASMMLARALKASQEERELTDSERKALKKEIDYAYKELRNGIEIKERE